MDYCINKTVSICNNLFNYCINLCLQDNACYCQCIDDDANYNKLCVYNNAVNINLLIFIIFASCLSCITCYCIKLGIYKRILRNSRNTHNMQNNTPLDSITDSSLNTTNSLNSFHTSTTMNNYSAIEDNDSLPKYNQLEHYAPPPEYFLIMYNNTTNTSSTNNASSPNNASSLATLPLTSNASVQTHIASI